MDSKLRCVFELPAKPVKSTGTVGEAKPLTAATADANTPGPCAKPFSFI